jgi:hypothetical protein
LFGGRLAPREVEPEPAVSQRRILRVVQGYAHACTIWDTPGSAEPISGDAGEHETLHPTSAGADALAERVEAEVRGGELTGGPSSVAALAYLAIMPPRRAAEALRARATAIGDEARRLQEALDGAETTEIHMIEVHYLLSRLRHDMQWLTGTAHRIETGELAWP